MIRHPMFLRHPVVAIKRALRILINVIKRALRIPEEPYKEPYENQKSPTNTDQCHDRGSFAGMGWLRLVGSFKL